jgi:hypothetical protein
MTASLFHIYRIGLTSRLPNRPAVRKCDRSGESGIACCQLLQGSGSGLHISALCSTRGTYLVHHSATMLNGHISLSYGQLGKTKPKFEALLLTIPRHMQYLPFLLLFDECFWPCVLPPYANNGWRTPVLPKCQPYPFQVSPLLFSIVTTAGYFNTSFRALCDTLHLVTYLSLSNDSAFLSPHKTGSPAEGNSYDLTSLHDEDL